MATERFWNMGVTYDKQAFFYPFWANLARPKRQN